MLRKPSSAALRLLDTLRAASLAGFTLAALGPLSTRADSVASVWQGGASGEWNLAANWSPSSLFPDNGSGGDSYSATISGATVSLTTDISVDALSLTDATLSGARTLTSGYLGLSLAGANHLSSGMALHVTGTFAFADSTASLTNHGIVQFNASGPSAYSPSAATLTNASDGTLRFNPSYSTSVGDSSNSPFVLANHGTILADNGQSNSLYAPVTQSSTGLIRTTGAFSNLYLQSGGTLAGTLQADAGSYIYLSGSNTYTLDQTAITGSSTVSAFYTRLTGSLASGSLSVYSSLLTGSFVNESSATLHWDSATSFINSTASLTNHGTVQFNASGPSAYSPSAATLTNASDGTLRFNPSYSTSVGDSSNSPFVLANHGTVLADNGYSNSLYAPVTNTGLVHVRPGSSLSLQGGFVQTLGEVRVENASLSAGVGQTLVFEGGLLRADGSVFADLSLADTALEIGPAQTAESLFVYGDVTLSTGATASFDLDGGVQGDGYDFLSINGDATLGGDLVIRLSSSLASTIQATDEFTLLVATSIGGTFANVQSGQRISLSGGAGSFLVTITGTELKLGGFSAVPEPSAYAALTGLGSALVVLRRRRRA